MKKVRILRILLRTFKNPYNHDKIRTLEVEPKSTGKRSVCFGMSKPRIFNLKFVL